VGIVVLPAREVAVVLLGVLVRGVLLAFGEVASPWVVNAAVAGLLALGKVASVFLLEGVALFLLAGREAAMRGLVIVIVMLAVVMMLAVVVIVIVVVVMTVIVGGSFAHARASQAMRVAPLWTAGQAAVGDPIAMIQCDAARRLRNRMTTWTASATAVTTRPR
jgi:hypothetical protein